MPSPIVIFRLFSGQILLEALERKGKPSFFIIFFWGERVGQIITSTNLLHIILGGVVRPVTPPLATLPHDEEEVLPC